MGSHGAGGEGSGVDEGGGSESEGGWEDECDGDEALARRLQAEEERREWQQVRVWHLLDACLPVLLRITRRELVRVILAGEASVARRAAGAQAQC